jgi:glycosyltransferase involved in cell wall biosynthesis
MARVYIGVPTYKRPEMVQDAIRSIQAQTYTDFRVIVSDNASGDDVASRVARFIADIRDPRFLFVRQRQNGREYGQGRFFFADSAGCELLMILHDDDVLLPNCLAEGIIRLEAEPEAAFFVANAYGMDEVGRKSEALTRRHLRDQGRIGTTSGMYDVLKGHVGCGFAPISGTLFRRSALVRSGFVDNDLSGNYPFEANVFLRLGESRARAWFSTAELLGVRYHPNALRKLHLLNDPAVVDACVRLWSRRRFGGALERRRRILLSRYRRAEMHIKLKAGDYTAARACLLEALRDNPASLKAWGWAPAVLTAQAVTRVATAIVGRR